MNYHSYNEVLDYLEVFFNREIKDEGSLKEMLKTIEDCRNNETVTIRAIDQLFMDYRRKFQDYTLPSKEEEEVWMNILNSWQ
ncbi:hypothetical protein B1H58_04010 [Pantoea alhagi]|uniref:Uncharacterized protein n=1 Tax=Pantoea alhagi TaxID=1891675 RepID=A0A1W6B2D8_9GAMM|nr:hypothetical protein [Pantoea alhagi]ARJ41255.1 hypothetical protein B1H58_04010 [Pantoea alhagi]